MLWLIALPCRLLARWLFVRMMSSFRGQMRRVYRAPAVGLVLPPGCRGWAASVDQSSSLTATD